MVVLVLQIASHETYRQGYFINLRATIFGASVVQCDTYIQLHSASKVINPTIQVLYPLAILI